MKLSAVILVKNAESTIAECLKALEQFDEVVLADTGSSDKTLAIAREYRNVKCVHISFEHGFGVARNDAASHASNDWIVMVDSDEILSPELVEELHRPLDPNITYQIPFKNYYKGQWVRYGGWYPDYHLRVYHRKHYRFTSTKVHETLNSPPSKRKNLKNPLTHYSYQSIEQFLSKMQKYSTLFAEEPTRKKIGLGYILVKCWFVFFKTYVLRLGFLDGEIGFIIACYNSHTTFYKYLKLKERKHEV